MTSKIFLTVAWDIKETILNGPYNDFENAKVVLGEEILGTQMQGGVIGPLPFNQVIEDGAWLSTPTDLDKSMARQWAVFETTDKTVQYMAFGEDAEGFDKQPEAGKFTWIGNYEGECPADIYKELAQGVAGYEHRTFVVVPVGVFGPADWMRVAGDMLTQIKG